MKKIYALLFITSLGLSFFSCKKDSPEKNTLKIDGEWRTDYRIFEYYAGDKLMETNTENADKNNPELTSFNEDGTGTFKASGKVYTKFNYTVSQSAINFTNVTSLYSDKWMPTMDFKYTLIKHSDHELYFSTEGTVSPPSLYDKYITRVHLVK